jgi:hypothetical protein
MVTCPPQTWIATAVSGAKLAGLYPRCPRRWPPEATLNTATASRRGRDECLAGPQTVNAGRRRHIPRGVWL